MVSRVERIIPCDSFYSMCALAASLALACDLLRIIYIAHTHTRTHTYHLQSIMAYKIAFMLKPYVLQIVAHTDTEI